MQSRAFIGVQFFCRLWLHPTRLRTHIHINPPLQSACASSLYNYAHMSTNRRQNCTAHINCNTINSMLRLLTEKWNSICPYSRKIVNFFLLFWTILYIKVCMRCTNAANRRNSWVGFGLCFGGKYGHAK